MNTDHDDSLRCSTCAGKLKPWVVWVHEGDAGWLPLYCVTLEQAINVTHSYRNSMLTRRHSVTVQPVPELN